MLLEGVSDFSNALDLVKGEVVLSYRFQTSSSVYEGSQGSLMSTTISFGVYDSQLVSAVCAYGNSKPSATNGYADVVG